MSSGNLNERVVTVLNERKALVSSLKRNASGTVNGNSYTWWRYKTEQSLEAIGATPQEARDLTRNLTESYYYTH